MPAALIALLLMTSALADPTSGNGTRSSLRFSDYPVSGGSALVAPDVDMSDPLVRHYRTLLREALSKGPDFAGHFRVVEIGQGTGLITVVLLDISTGRVLAPPALASVSFPFPEDESVTERYGIERHVTSRLLVVRGVPDSVDSLGTFYFELRGSRLAFLRGFRWPSQFNRRPRPSRSPSPSQRSRGAA